MRSAVPSGFGLGLRSEFAETLSHTDRAVDWIEVIPENWMRFGGKVAQVFKIYADRWPVIPHSVSLSLGGVEDFDARFLAAAEDFCQEYRPAYWSDHLCFARAAKGYLHDLLPLPFTEDAVKHIVRRIKLAQDALRTPVVVENITYYTHFPGATLSELEFISAILERADCELLFDVNNVYVNSLNHGYDPNQIIDAIPVNRIRQIHLAGHRRRGGFVIDTHQGPIIDPVWEIYRRIIARAGRILPTLIEWDSEIPALPLVLDEVDRARAHAERALAKAE